MLLLAFLISVGTSVWGQEEPSTSREVDLSVTEGQGETGTQGQTLAAALGDEANSITELKIIGPLTAEDFVTLKNMARLQVLDMSGVTALPEIVFRMDGIDQQNFMGIPANTFVDKWTLKRVVFPTCMELIAPYAFAGCGGLESIDVPNDSNLKSIGEQAFSKCSSLENLDLSSISSLYSIGTHAFYLCDNLRKVDLSDCSALSFIGWNAFYSCVSLLSVDFSNCSSLTTIEKQTFDGCSALETVVLTNCSGLTTIEQSAFRFTNLSGFDFSELSSLKTIGHGAFRETHFHGELVLNKHLQNITSEAFAYCSGITFLKFESESELKTLSSEAFASCYALKSVDFSNCNYLETIENEAFKNCCSLSSITINNNRYISNDGVLFVVDGNTLLFYPYAKENESYTIPNSVQKIASNAFNFTTWGYDYPISKLKDITIPESVRSIETDAFAGVVGKIIRLCAEVPIGLTGDIGLSGALVYVPKGSLSAYKQAAVWKTYTLFETGAKGTTVELMSAGTLASKLTGVDLGTIQELKVSGPMNTNDFEVIKQMTLLTKVDLSEATMEENKLPNYAFSCFANDVEQLMAYLIEVILPEGITEIGDGAFSYLYQLEKVNIPTSVERIGSEAFAHCHRFSSLDVSLLTNLKSIGRNAFGGCRSVSSTMQFPNTLERIGQSAFSGTNVTSVDFSNTALNGVESYAFSDCAITGDLSFPATLTHIGNGAFDAATPSSIKLKSSNMVSLGGTDVFKAAKGTTCTVYVPKGLGETYKADTYWSPFRNNIEEYGHLVTVTVNDDHGDSYGYATGGGAYEEGETVTLTASLYEYRNGLFAGWFENNQKLSGESTYSFTMGNVDLSIEARFSKDGYGIDGWSETVTDPDKADGQTVTIWPYGSSLWVKGDLAWNLKEFKFRELVGTIN